MWLMKQKMAAMNGAESEGAREAEAMLSIISLYRREERENVAYGWEEMMALLS